MFMWRIRVWRQLGLIDNLIMDDIFVVKHMMP